MAEGNKNFERPEIRIVGSVSEQEKSEFHEKLQGRFGEGHLDQIPPDKLKIFEENEYEKEPYETDSIHLANGIINGIRTKHGLPAFDVPPRNIHIVPKDIYKGIDDKENRAGVTAGAAQFIAINKDVFDGNKVVEADTILHEMVHLKGYMAYEVGEGGVNAPYRSGLKIFPTFKKEAKQGGYKLFSGLGEAVVAEITKRWSKKILADNPGLKKEKEWMDSAAAKDKMKEITAKRNYPEDEIEFAGEDGVHWLHTYYFQRRVLYFILEKIAEDKQISEDSVWEDFEKAHFTGNILGIAKSVKASFGEDAFNFLGTMDASETSANMVLDYLKKKRRKIEARKHRETDKPI